MSINDSLSSIFSNNNLDDLPLDFIGMKYFSDQYLFKGILGAGSFAVVLRVMEHATREEFALKVILIYKS
jgi:hypothetical protein